MTQKQAISLIEYTLENKLKENEEIIKYSFYELTVKYNLSESDKNLFLKLLKIKLENNNYNVYTEGQIYEYNNTRKEVKENELIVAIKRAL
ncbi:MAG: hypothetical protein J5507_02895 [Clostridia bacterium]|nr:hypothetical protein [Clostridia bacterium]